MRCVQNNVGVNYARMHACMHACTDPLFSWESIKIETFIRRLLLLTEQEPRALSPAMRLPDHDERPTYLQSRRDRSNHESRSEIPSLASTPDRPR